MRNARTHAAGAPNTLGSSAGVRLTAGVVVAIGFVLVLGTQAARADLGSDFTQDWLAARSWLQGYDPYAPLNEQAERYLPNHTLVVPELYTPHPPALIALYAPVALLPFDVAAGTWVVLMGICFVAAVARIGLTLGWPARAAIVAGMALWLLIPPAYSEAIFVQNTSLVLLLLALGWTSRRPGLWAGLAAAIKLFPALMLVPLVRHRRWSDAAMLVVVAAGLNGVGFLAGFDAAGYFDATTSNGDRFVASAHNQSLLTLPSRVGLEGAVALVLTLAIAAACVYLLMRGRYGLTDGWWGMVAWMLLLSPLSWYSILLVGPVLLLVGHRGVERDRKVVFVALAALAMAGVLPGIADELPAGAGALPYLVPTLAILLFALGDQATEQRPGDGPRWAGGRATAGASRGASAGSRAGGAGV